MSTRNKIIAFCFLIFICLIGYIFYNNSKQTNSFKEIEIKRISIPSSFEKPKDNSGVILNEVIVTPEGTYTIPIKEESKREYEVILSKSKEDITTELQIKQDGKTYTIIPKTTIINSESRDEGITKNKLFRPTINIVPYVGFQINKLEPIYGIGLHTNLLKTEHFSYIEFGISVSSKKEVQVEFVPITYALPILNNTNIGPYISYNLNGDIGTGLTISVEL